MGTIFWQKLVFSKLIFRGTLWAIFPKKIWNFRFFFGLRAKKNFWLVFSKVIAMCLGEHFGRKQTVSKNLRVYNFFQTLSEQFSATVVKTAVTCVEDHLRDFFLKKLNLYVFWTLSENVSDIELNFSAELSKQDTTYVSIGTFSSLKFCHTSSCWRGICKW